MQCTDLGGTERASLQLMTGLQQCGHECRAISLNPLGRLAPLLEKQGISVYGLPYRGTGGIMSVPYLRSRLKREDCEVLIMTGPNLMAMMNLGNLGNNCRVLAVHHHHTGEKPRWQWRLIYRVACKLFKAVTFPSDFIRQEAEQLYPPIAKKSHTIRNPIILPPLPTSEQKRVARLSIGIPPDAKVIGNAGWLIPRKRLDIFLRVAAKVAGKNSIVCVIAGDGPERTKLHRLANELGIAKFVRWLGWQEDLSDFYHTLDCLLFNSDWEALSMTALEGLSYGVPLVASIRHGGLKEIVSSEQHGFLFADHDIDKLANSVVKSFESSNIQMAAVRRARVEESCNFKGCVATVERLFSCN